MNLASVYDCTVGVLSTLRIFHRMVLGCYRYCYSDFSYSNPGRSYLESLQCFSGSISVYPLTFYAFCSHLLGKTGLSTLESRQRGQNLQTQMQWWCHLSTFWSTLVNNLSMASSIYGGSIAAVKLFPCSWIALFCLDVAVLNRILRLFVVYRFVLSRSSLLAQQIIRPIFQVF